MKYNEELVNKYIYGLEIEDYNIEELENDIEFMEEVILKTRDKNFYKLCSKELKNDYKFIKFIIDLFKTDKEFICQVADKYLDNVNDETNRIELLIIMNNLVNDNKYKIDLDGIFMSNRLAFELYKLKKGDDKIGLGFLLISMSYMNNKLILDYYAKRLVETIFEEYDINLEHLLHKEFREVEDIDNNYIINFINRYDKMLAKYVSNNKELLDDLVEEISKIKVNWYAYIKNQEKNRYSAIIKYIREYMMYDVSNCRLTDLEMLYLIGIELNIAEKIYEYDDIDEDLYESIVDELSYISVDNLNDTEKEVYKFLLKVIKEIVIIGDSTDPDEMSSNDKGKRKKKKGKNIQ